VLCPCQQAGVPATAVATEAPHPECKETMEPVLLVSRAWPRDSCQARPKCGDEITSWAYLVQQGQQELLRSSSAPISLLWVRQISPSQECVGEPRSGRLSSGRRHLCSRVEVLPCPAPCFRKCRYHASAQQRLLGLPRLLQR